MGVVGIDMQMTEFLYKSKSDVNCRRCATDDTDSLERVGTYFEELRGAW